MSGTKGYIKLYRKIRDNWKWPGVEKKNQPYSLIEAWQDLIMEAAYKAQSRLVNDRLFRLKRGEFVASIRYLAKRWNWGMMKTRLYLNKLQSEGEITRNTTQGMTRITICKYNYYNPLQHTKKHTDNTLTTQRQHKSNKVKKVKKSISSKEDIPNHQKLVQEFADRYKLKYGSDYKWDKVDFINAAKLLKDFSWDECLKRMDNGFKYKYWFGEMRTFGKYIKQFNELVKPPKKKKGELTEPSTDWTKKGKM